MTPKERKHNVFEETPLENSADTLRDAVSPMRESTTECTRTIQKMTTKDKCSDKIIVHDVVVFKPPIIMPDVKISKDSFMSNDRSTNRQSLEVVPMNDLNIISVKSDIQKVNYENDPSSPEDPFYTSESSEYCPSDDEVDLSTSSVISRRVTRNAKKIEKKIDSRNNHVFENSELALQNKENSNEYYGESIMQSPKQDRKDEDFTNEEIDKKNLTKPKKPYKRKPDHCYFCETEVHNFSRHVIRNHSTEISVAEILSKKKKSKERRNLLDKLRRKGNFLGSAAGQVKAVRQPDIPGRSLLPCDNCLGFFSNKLLYKHRKKCTGKNKNGNSQVAGQLTLIVNNRVDKRLLEEVFPHMRADKVSLEAQNDNLICRFGSRYITMHREKHFVHVASRKMRELSKVLIELRKLEPSITNMYSALQPQYFDLFVLAVKTIAKYDSEKDIYLSPTFAMNIVTSLKQCCDIAITYAYKKSVPYLTISSADVEANLKTLIRLFESNWKYEVSSQAGNNLSLNKWNKITVIPLASDLKLLRQYLLNIAEDSIIRLNQKKDVEAYNNLMESVYCRVILLNRKRPGELQRTPLHAYSINNSDKQEYEEFNRIVSSQEQILLKSLKRIVIRGKRGKGVPVLFSADVQRHIGTLLDLRCEYVPKENIYFFAKANSLTNLIGYKTLHKHANRCGAKNPLSITSTRLRKHLATLSQLFNLSDNEIEQLATFMGHTPGVHRNSYRLPDDVYQTVKISKLLLIMEKGSADKYKGKTLDEVNIDMEENLLQDKSDDESVIDHFTEDVLPGSSNSVPSTSQTMVPQICTQNKGKRTLVSWTSQQKQAAKHFFKSHIKNSIPPKKHECENLKEKHSDLFENKNWLKIKVFIQNEYRKKKD